MPKIPSLELPSLPSIFNSLVGFRKTRPQAIVKFQTDQVNKFRVFDTKMRAKKVKSRVLTGCFVPFNAIVIEIDVVPCLSLVFRHVVIAGIHSLVLLRVHFTAVNA